MTLGQRIKQNRERLNMTQEQLACLLCTTKQNIYKYESGIITNIPLDKIEIMAKAFRMHPAELLGWIHTKEPDVADTGSSALQDTELDRELEKLLHQLPSKTKAALLVFLKQL